MAESLFDLVGSLFPDKSKNTSITSVQDDPIKPMHEDIKKSGLKPGHVDQIFQLVGSGKVMPGTKEFSDALGIGMEQNGLAPTAAFGPFGRIRDAFSPKAKNIIAQQQVADKIGGLVLQQIVEMKQREAMGPGSLREAQQALPGVIQPVQSQRGASLDQIVGQGMQGPTREADPEAPLTPFQQQLAATTLNSMGEGRLMRTEEGIVPTGYSTVQGRRVSPDEFDFAQKAALAPAGSEILPPSGSLPQPLVNKILEERGQAGRQLMKGPDLNNRLESLAAVESVKKFGAPLNFTQIAAKDPVFASQLRQQAEIQESKDIFSFQQGEMMKRAIAQTGPVVEAKAAAERRQPVGGEVSKYARLGKGGIIERPSDGTMTQDDLNKQGFIDTSRSQKEIDGLNDLEVIEKDFKKLRMYADELFTAGGGLGAKINQKGRLVIERLTNGGAPTRIKGSDGKPLTRGELANVYQNEVTSMLEYYGRNLKGIRGTATEGDVKRMQKNFAADWTSKAVKDRLMDDTRNLIGDIRTAAHKTIFGEKAVEQATQKPEEDIRSRIRQLLSEDKTEDEIMAILGK
ncbi:MAG: hypothetical protein ACRCZI_06565 [Cetobacterium sp.]